MGILDFEEFIFEVDRMFFEALCRGNQKIIESILVYAINKCSSIEEEKILGERLHETYIEHKKANA